MIEQLRGFVRFWSAFVIGDDRQVAIGVVAALAVTALIAGSTALPVWWVVVAAVLVLLPHSIRKAVRAFDEHPPTFRSA